MDIGDSMRKSTITHEHLKKALKDIENVEEDDIDEVFERMMAEIRHSSLIVAGNVEMNKINIPTMVNDMGTYGALFTDMNEFEKVFPDFPVGASENSIDYYLEMLEQSDLSGFIVNAKSDFFVLPREILDFIDDIPEYSFPSDDSYTSEELKNLKDSIDNSSLESFIMDSSNIGRYEELFDEISKSTLLALRLSRENVDGMAEDGIISMKESGPIGFLYMDTLGGKYAVAFTSEEKISSVNIPLNKYSQIINFSQMTNYMLADDMDGIIINPNSENILLTRDVMLEFSNLLEKTCNNHKLNSGIYHMFLIDA